MPQQTAVVLETSLSKLAMPARDKYHNTVKAALIKDGWEISHDPLQLRIGKKDLYVDLGAERLISAEKGNVKIAVEVKSFSSGSEVEDLEQALGQYTLYLDVLAQQEPARILYLAVRQAVFEDLFEEPIGQLLLRNQRVRLVVFDSTKEVINQWIPQL
jgi:hypothetical protein